MKIYYRRKYPIGSFLTEDIGFEIETPDWVDDPERTQREALAAVSTLKELCDKAHKEINPGFHEQYEQREAVIIPVEESIGRTREDVIKAHLTTISECKTLRNLEMFANMVQRENEQVLFDAYQKKKTELIQPEIKDIMDRTEALTKKSNQ